jgi:hypothetical protein
MAITTKKDTFTYTQSTPSALWTITHNLSTPAPVVSVWIDDDSNTTAMIPQSIAIIDVNTIAISFTSEHIGSAVIG